jgi:hypothetical protein
LEITEGELTYTRPNSPEEGGQGNPAFLVYHRDQATWKLPPLEQKPNYLSSLRYFYLVQKENLDWDLVWFLPKQKDSEENIFWSAYREKEKPQLVFAFETRRGSTPDLAWQGENSKGVEFFRPITSEVKRKSKAGYLLATRYD